MDESSVFKTMTKATDRSWVKNRLAQAREYFHSGKISKKEYAERINSAKEEYLANLKSAKSIGK